MADPPVPQTPAAASLTTRLRIGLGTFIAIDAEADLAQIGQSGLQAAFAAIEQVGRLLHPTRDGSDLAAINAAAPGALIPVHPWTWEVLALAQRLHRLSRGVFDPCLPTACGTLADLHLLPRRAVPPRAGEALGVVPRVRLMLDLGGIGKGFAVDRGIEALRASGCRGGLVNAGGDLAVFGAREHVLLCRDPRGVSTRVTLRDAALAASDVTGEGRPGEHRGYYDGRDGRPIVSGRVAITAPSAAAADALTKCLLVDPANHRLLAAFGARRIGW